MISKPDLSVSISRATAQGGRDHQEDRAVDLWIESPSASGWLMAIFDGHGGSVTAERAARALPDLFASRLAERNDDAAEALRDAVRTLNDLTQQERSGSTASVAFIPADAHVVTVAILGDSPVAILDSAGQFHIGPDHNVRTNLQERAAAEARGGAYRAGYLEDTERPGVGLQMARSLGDMQLSRILDRSPDIDLVRMGGKGIAVVGSDGLLIPGGGSNEDQLKRLLSLVQNGADAKALVADALARGSDDNVTAIVWVKS